MWTPTYVAKNREQLIRFTLKNLIIYLIFLLITSIIILGLVPSLRFHFTQAFHKQFIEEQFEVAEGAFITFSDIKTAAHLWTYLEQVIEVYLYNEYWYSWSDPIANATEDDQKILFENKLLGVPRLRQLRVRNDSCTIHEDFKTLFIGCYSGFSTYSEDKESFGPGEGTAWVFNDPTTNYYHYGRAATYHTGGYYQDLGLTRNKTHSILENLKQNLWITRNTRAIFLDFTVYNGNVNLFCIAKLVFEFPPTGGIIPSSTFNTVHLIDYVTTEDYFYFGLKMIFICFIIYYTAGEIHALILLKKIYFKIWWSYIEILILFDLYATIIFSIYKYFFIEKQIQLVHEYPEDYTSYELVGYVYMHVNNILAIMLFIMWIKIFKFINLSRTMGQLNNTLTKCAGDVLGFSLMFFIVFFAFSQMGYLLFGSQVQSFSSFGTSVLTLLMTILGEFDYYEIESSNKIIAPIFFVTYIFFVFFVLINMFLAIITDTYSDVKEEINLKQSELEFKDFIRRAPRNLMTKCTKKRYVIDKKLPGNVIVEKIRNILETCNFTDTEIQAFFSMYNINEHKKMTNDDINNFLATLRRINTGETSKLTPNKGDIGNKLTMTAFMKQQEKLNSLEKQIQELKKNVDILVKNKK